MLYVYYGEDIDTARKKVQATTARMLAKNPDALYFRVTADDVSLSALEELTQSQALFKSEYIVVLDRVSERPESAEVVFAQLQQLKEAPHPIFLLEGTLKAPEKKKIEKYADSVEVFEMRERKAVTSFNTFALTDALAARDTRALWTLFRDAKRHGVSDEEIHGILFWMLKTLALTAQSASAEEAGLKPFPYKKAQTALRQFESPEVLHERVRTFALLPQHARRRGITLEILLEHYILSYT